MATTSPTIAVAGLTKRFGSVTAVDRLSLDVRPGEIFGLVGPDGSGKTTTMRMLAGIMAPNGGTATIDGCDVVRRPEEAKSHLSYMSQRFGLYEDLTVDENIHFYADVFGMRRAERSRRASELLAAAGLVGVGGRLAGQLSGGMKQKLGLVCALIHTPRVLLLDEPTNGVDPVSRRDFWRLLYALLSEGVAILISTSYLDEAERCHRVGLLYEGRLLFCDTPDALKKRFAGGVVSIRSAAPAAVRSAIAGARCARSVLVVGDSVHVFVDDSRVGAAELKAALDAARATYDAVDVVAPSIEDVFVSAVEAAAS